jgi:hypothetical protein
MIEDKEEHLDFIDELLAAASSGDTDSLKDLIFKINEITKKRNAILNTIAEDYDPSENLHTR